jgi:hypothetical protein
MRVTQQHDFSDACNACNAFFAFNRPRRNFLGGIAPVSAEIAVVGERQSTFLAAADSVEKLFNGLPGSDVPHQETGTPATSCGESVFAVPPFGGRSIPAKAGATNVPSVRSGRRS